MVSSIGSSGNSPVAEVLKQQQQQVAKQQDEQRIAEQRNEAERQVQQDRRSQQSENIADARKGSLVDVSA